MAKNGITVYLPRDLEGKVERLAFLQHRSVSSVITQAVRARIGAERDDGSVEGLVEALRARMDARLDKAIGETLILKEVVLLFVRIWIEHNPPIEEELEDAAAASAEARYERFLALVAYAVRGGRSPLTAETAQSERQAPHQDGSA